MYITTEKCGGQVSVTPTLPRRRLPAYLSANLRSIKSMISLCFAKGCGLIVGPQKKRSLWVSNGEDHMRENQVVRAGLTT